MNVEIAQRLAELRRERGFSQEGLAEQLGLSRHRSRRRLAVCARWLDGLCGWNAMGEIAGYAGDAVGEMADYAGDAASEVADATLHSGVRGGVAATNEGAISKSMPAR